MPLNDLRHRLPRWTDRNRRDVSLASHNALYVAFDRHRASHIPHSALFPRRIALDNALDPCSRFLCRRSPPREFPPPHLRHRIALLPRKQKRIIRGIRQNPPPMRAVFRRFFSFFKHLTHKTCKTPTFSILFLPPSEKSKSELPLNYLLCNRFAPNGNSNQSTYLLAHPLHTFPFIRPLFQSFQQFSTADLQISVDE